jgi:hypothetical protein
VQQFPIKQSNQLITEISKGGDNLCKGDRSAYVNMLVDTSSGILPFRYLWRNTTNDSIGVSRTRYNLPKGSYKCTVTSSNGCTGVDSIVINEPLLPISTQVISTVNPTTLQVNPVGHIDSSSPLVVTYDLSGQLTAFRYKGCTMRWENGSIDFKYVNPPLGTLRYTLTNHKGCSKLDSIQICSSTSSAILFNVSSNFLKASANRMADTIKINVNGGAAPYRYFWSTGGTDSVQSAIARGIYNYTVTDRNGCTSSGAHIDTVVDSVDVKFRVSFKGSGKRVHPSGVRVTGGLGATTQPDWNPAAAKVMVLEAPTSDSVYSVNIKVPRRAPNEIYEFKYVNGNDWGTGANGTPEDERSVPAPCRRDLNDNRFFTLIPFPATSMILPCYKFNTCTVFPTVGTADFVSVKHLTIAPNPMSSNMHVFFTNDNKELYALEIVNSMGQVVRSYPFTMDSDFTVERGALATGLYLARLRNPLGQFLNAKFMIE